MGTVGDYEENAVGKYDESKKQKKGGLDMISVIYIAPIENYRLKVRLSDGRQGIFDVTPYLDIGVFRELRDITYFKRVKIAFNGAGIMWPHEQDLSAETIECKLQ